MNSSKKTQKLRKPYIAGIFHGSFLYFFKAAFSSFLEECFCTQGSLLNKNQFLGLGLSLFVRDLSCLGRVEDPQKKVSSVGGKIPSLNTKMGPAKLDGLEPMKAFLLEQVWPIFRGKLAVSFREGI